jgi:hypothetical protein
MLTVKKFFFTELPLRGRPCGVGEADDFETSKIISEG